MSRAAVIVALLITVALVAAALLLMPRGGKASAAAGPLLDFEPAALVEIRVRHADGREEAARRVGPSAWVIDLGRREAWPAAGERVRPAVRILSTLEPVRKAERVAEPPADSPSVLLRLEDGGTRSMRLAPRPLAGAVLVRVEGGEGVKSAWVDAAVSDMLIGTGLGAWRETSPLGEIGPDVARVRLRSGEREVALGRVQGRWALTVPLAHAAEADAVARVLSLASQARVRDFLDGGPPERTGLETPAAVLRIERDVREAGGARGSITEVRTLEVGTTADVGGRTVFARLSGSTEGADGEGWSRVVILEGQPLAEIPTDPAFYIARRVLGAPASEIGALVLGSREDREVRFERGLDGWRRAEAGSAAPLRQGEEQMIDTLLKVLTQEPATGVELRTPEGARRIARLEVRSLGGEPLAELHLGTSAGGLVVSGGEVWRIYAGPVAARLAEELERALGGNP